MPVGIRYGFGEDGKESVRGEESYEPADDKPEDEKPAR